MGKAESDSESWQRKKTDPRSDWILREWVQVKQRPMEGESGWFRLAAMHEAYSRMKWTEHLDERRCQMPGPTVNGKVTAG